MRTLSDSKMSAIEQNRIRKKEKLRVLTSRPFDINNQEQIKSLKQYVDEFELSANQMYFFQSIKAAWISSFFLPLPNLANYFITALLSVGVVFDRFSITDFSEPLTEMKEIYNWCLKGGSANYSSAIDNTAKLDSPLIQRMVKLIAPLCSNDFMLAWTKEAKPVEPKGVLANVLSYGYSSLSSAYSLISSPSKQTVNLDRIRELKIGVETRSFDVGIINGLEQSIRYFATNPDFKTLMLTKISKPIDALRATVPEAVRGVLSHSHSN